MSPSDTDCPSLHRISVTTPGSSASTGISIFIDSRITTASPSCNAVADLDLDLPDGAGDVGFDLGQIGLLVTVAWGRGA